MALLASLCGETTGRASSVSDEVTSCPTSERIEAGNYELQWPAGFETDKALVVELVTELRQHVDPAEPFGRIHEAIREAQRIDARSSEAHVQAA
jgi:hypothetical protein